MIYKHQRIVFWVMVGCIVLMATLLFFERQRGRERILSLANQMPLDAPAASTEPVTLDLANDSDGSIHSEQRQMALPVELNARVRALLDQLIAEYALPGSAHPLQQGSAVSEVFLLPLPVVGYAANTSAPARADGENPAPTPVAGTTPGPAAANPGGELAVIDLRSTFVNQHPSGVEVESLTLLSIVGTLHANVPQIEQVRFLVDGQPRETLAGHADLLRTYPSRETATAMTGGGGP
jgi:hypothetical protein